MNIKLIPFETFSLTLPASCQTTLNTVDRHTHESKLGQSFNPLLKAFGGMVTTQGFKIRRSVEYQNSFSPIILGQIKPTDDEQCSLDIKMRMHFFVMGFMLVWLSGALLMTFGDFSFAISGKNAFITFIIGYWIMMHSFWKEVRLAKKELDIIFEELSE